MQQFQNSCSMVQKSFLAEAWLQYRQEPSGMLKWLESYMEKAFEKSGWCTVSEIMELFENDESEDGD